MIVFDDADPAAVAEGIKIAGYWNSGQDCTAASRIVAGPKSTTSCSRSSCPRSSRSRSAIQRRDDIEMGPVISKAQQERVLGFLERREEARPS